MTTTDTGRGPAHRSGIDVSALDPETRPQDDLYRHVNGRWLSSHVIPADRAADGAFRTLHDEAEAHVRAIIEELGASGGSDGLTGVAAQIGGLYASFMDESRIAGLGVEPLRDELELVTGAQDRAALTDVLGALQRTGGAGAFGFWVDNDAKDPEKYVVHLYQAGLGLPDESYYREDKYAEIRSQYTAHVARMLTLAGVFDAATAPDAADRVLALETRLASHHWDVVQDRDSELTYNPMTLAALAEQADGLDWHAWARSVGAPAAALEDVVVREPEFFTGLAQLWRSEPLDDWKAWFVYHLVSARAPYLSDDVVEANFDFYGRTLSGAQEVRDRWKRGVSLVEGALGEAVGEIYVARHFPPTHKERMDVLVKNLIEAYRVSITELDWMGQETRTKALAKLAAFDPKVGYPKKWRDYSALVIDPADLVGNVRRSNELDLDRELAKIGTPIDRDEWHMTPQTVNAYYNPSMNEIVFPAAILQPPFFDPDADDAANYGGIGAVIGHEIGHGFDDQGSKYDGAGRLEDWWTSSDRTEFDKRAAQLVAQYDVFHPEQLGPEHTVNGALTIGENIGDLGGLSIALKAYAISLGTDLSAAPVVEGLTGAERVFLSWAQVWQTTMRDEAAMQRLATAPHSPAEFRCNGVVRNIDEFYSTYNVQPGDALYLPSEERVRIW